MAALYRWAYGGLLRIAGGGVNHAIALHWTPCLLAAEVARHPLVPG